MESDTDLRTFKRANINQAQQRASRYTERGQFLIQNFFQNLSPALPFTGCIVLIDGRQMMIAGWRSLTPVPAQMQLCAASARLEKQSKRHQGPIDIHHRPSALISFPIATLGCLTPPS